MSRIRKDATVELVRYRLLRKDTQEQCEITVWFRCPHCYKRHRARELSIAPHVFSVVGYSLRCGDVRVQMPWVFAAAKKKHVHVREYAGVLICNGKVVTQATK